MKPLTELVACFASELSPGRRGARDRYLPRGLRGRKIGEGVYRFRREDGRPLDLLAVQVQLADPWGDETVWSLVSTCSEHILCTQRGEDCRVVMKPQMVRRWFVVTTPHKNFFDVELYAARSSKTRVVTRKLSSGPGFYVMLTSRTCSPTQEKPCTS